MFRTSSLLLGCLFFASAFGAAPQSYVRQATTCDGYPRVAIDMAPGFCAGLVTSPANDDFRHRAMKTPRMLLQLKDEKRWLVTDLGVWTAGRGKVWLMEVGPSGEVSLKELLSGLTLPHTVAFGPDGNIY